MAAKPLSLADRIRAKRKSNRSETEVSAEQDLVKNIIAVNSANEPLQTPIEDELAPGNFEGQGRDRVGTVSGQYQDRDIEGTLLGHGRDTTVTPLGHHCDTTVTPPKAKKGHGRDTIKKGQGRDSIQKEIKLADKQLQIYKWFLQNGHRSTFNKPLIMDQTGIAFTTIRKALRKFENIGLLRFSYDDCTKLFEYEINTKINVKNLDFGQGRDRVGTVSGQGRDTAFISSSSLLNKTTTTQNCESDAEKLISQIMSADPEYKYWHEQHVSPKQVTVWKNEFGLDLQTILNNLCYARWQILNQKQKINKSSADFIYGIMKKNGGKFNKPAGYKNMAQLDLEFYENWRKERQEQQEKIDQIKSDAIQAEIEPKITAILEALDLENEDLQAAIKNIRTDRRRNLILNAIKSGKQLADPERSALEGYLEQILKEKAINKLNL